jgi:hypothetical protein
MTSWRNEMKVKTDGKEKRKADPYLDRRSGDDRRQIYMIDYFSAGNPERRTGKERRDEVERRKDCMRVSRWSSVCVDQRESVWIA